MKVGVVDYDAGNLKSVQTALAHLGVDQVVSSNPEELLAADRLVFPGVGDASSAMRVLRSRGLDVMIREFVSRGDPVLGICLGSQIVLERSEEGNADCLGIVPGVSVRFPKELGLKVPHMGWNQVSFRKGHPLFRGIPQGTSFFFVHSYYTQPSRSDLVLCESEYGEKFCCGLLAGNLAATQFHPEKSGEYGLKLLSNFLYWDPERTY
ncbi:MAG: imidazole glycerol phosphate synthase subunit HisH [Spirochaetaceae bacterium]|nr:MAG: imidazole glycerol phosphate synthase subunit HisH [Spirochaetaceae bacterium]